MVDAERSLMCRNLITTLHLMGNVDWDAEVFLHKQFINFSFKSLNGSSNVTIVTQTYQMAYLS